ncbi:unnamed protein product, partial [Amoebophrya sp. A120]
SRQFIPKDSLQYESDVLPCWGIAQYNKPEHTWKYKPQHLKYYMIHEQKGPQNNGIFGGGNMMNNNTTGLAAKTNSWNPQAGSMWSTNEQDQHTLVSNTDAQYQLRQGALSDPGADPLPELLAIEAECSPWARAKAFEMRRTGWVAVKCGFENAVGYNTAP